MEALYVGAFPADERRDCAVLKHIIDTNPLIHCCVITDDYGIFLGFINYWTFEKFCYIEHFAVDQAQRGSGVGTNALHAMTDVCTKPTVLEVELPDNDLARRRIEFYQRCGFSVWHPDIIYVQPPYRTDSSSLEMLLMAKPASEMPDHETVVATLRREVYGIRPM